MSNFPHELNCPGGGFGRPGVVLEQVEAVAKPLLVPVLKKPPPGRPKPPPGQVRGQNLTRTISGRGL